MRLFIFGCTGFLGREIALEAVASARERDEQGKEQEEGGGAASVENISISGTTRSASLATAPDGVVLHAAPSLSELDESALRDLREATHVVSTFPPVTGESADPVLADARVRRALDYAAFSGTLEWIGYVSATSVYGNHDGRSVDESTVPTPKAGRGERRLRAELEWRDTGYPVHVFRLPAIYGPGRGPLARARKEGSALSLIHKPGHVFNYIYVRDAARAIVLSMRRPDPGRVYNVTDDLAAESADTLEYACALLGVSPMPARVPYEEAAQSMSAMARSFYTDCRRSSSARVRTELGFRPAFPTFREGLAHQLEVERNGPAVDADAALGRTNADTVGSNMTTTVLDGGPQILAITSRLAFFAQDVWNAVLQRLLGFLLVQRLRALFTRPAAVAVVLVDNGSVEAAPTLQMRALACALEESVLTSRTWQSRWGGGRSTLCVMPTSLKFSDRVDARALGGTPAQLLSDALRDDARVRSSTRLIIVPVFLGPSRAVTSTIPKTVKEARPTDAEAHEVLPALVPMNGPDAPGLDPITRILADMVRDTARANRLENGTFGVVLVDHGSPSRDVNRVRRALTARLRRALGRDAAVVVGSSMERRPGAQYAFNEPLLENVFDAHPGLADCRDVVLAMAFLFDGKHAGPDGDVDRIVSEAVRSRARAIRVFRTPTIARSPERLAGVLAERLVSVL